MKRACKYCHTSFNVFPSRAHRDFFCDRECYLKSRLINGKHSYAAVHQWLLKTFGKAKKCESPTCNGKSNKFEWSQLHDKPLEKARSSFWHLCKSCHTLYYWKEDTSLKSSIAHKNQIPWHKGKTGVYSREALDKMRLAKLHFIK